MLCNLLATPLWRRNLQTLFRKVVGSRSPVNQPSGCCLSSLGIIVEFSFFFSRPFLPCLLTFNMQGVFLALGAKTFSSEFVFSVLRDEKYALTSCAKKKTLISKKCY